MNNQSVRLSKEEIKYLLESNILPHALSEFLQKNAQHVSGTIMRLDLTVQLAEKFRDLLFNQVDVIGFNKMYELTDEGKLLEDLADRFNEVALRN